MAKTGKHFGVDYNAPVTLSFILLCVLLHVLNAMTGDFLITDYFACFRTGFLDPLQYMRLFTHVLGHADLSHLMGNALIILITAPMIEEKYGSRDVFFMILITAFVTGLSHTLFFGDKLLLGASGIAFMFILLSSFANVQKRRIPLTFILVVLLYIGQEIVAMCTVTDNVSRITHIIGGMCGAAFGFVRR